MGAFRIIVAAGMILIFCPSLGWSETGSELTPLPAKLIIGDTTYMVIPGASIPGEITSRLPDAYRFQKGKATQSLDKSLRHWLGGYEFLRTPDGRYALPFEGSAPFVGYIDLSKREFIYYKDIFAPTGEERGEGHFTRYKWTGVLDQRPDQEAMLWLFVRRWDRKQQTFSSHRVRIPLTAPNNIQVERMTHAAVEQVFAQIKYEILCKLVEDGNRTWARLLTNTWGVLAKGKPSKEYGRLGRAAYSPDGSDIYAIYAGAGLVIFDAENGIEKVHHAELGSYANAFTFGVTFDPGGFVGVVTTPYRRRIALIDVKTRRILSEYQTESPLAGILFDDREPKAYAYPAFLPYE